MCAAINLVAVPLFLRISLYLSLETYPQHHCKILFAYTGSMFKVTENHKIEIDNAMIAFKGSYHSNLKIKTIV